VVLGGWRQEMEEGGKVAAEAEVTEKAHGMEWTGSFPQTRLLA